MRAILLLLVLSLGACGFHLRGHNMQGKDFPFDSLYLKFNSPTPFVSDLHNSLELYKIKLVPLSTQADLTLDIVSEGTDKQIQALSATGQVLEYQLRYRVSLRAYDKEMQDWMSADEIQLQRTLTYDAAQVLAKEQEEALLFRDMRSDAVQQVLRRLSRVKPRPDPTKATNSTIPAPMSTTEPASNSSPSTTPVPLK
jgi:LPS-assembly lipoprotein